MNNRLLLFLLVSAISLACCTRSGNKKNSSNQIISSDSSRVNALLDSALAIVYRPGENKSDLDSALLFVGQAVSINQKNDNLILSAKAEYILSNDFREAGNKAGGKLHIKKAIAILEKLSSPAQLGECYVELSNYYSLEADEEPMKKACFEKAAVQFQLAGLKEKEASALKYIGDIEQDMGNYGRAMVLFKQSLAIYTEMGFKEIDGLYDLMGVTSLNLGDNANAIKYGLLAVKTAEESNDTSIQLATIYSRLGISYGFWGKPNEALLYARKSMAIAIKYNDKQVMQMLLPNLCIALLRKESSGEVINTIRSIESQLSVKTIQDSVYLFSSYINAYQKDKNTREAEKYVLLLEEIIARGRHDIALELAYTALTQYFMTTKKYGSVQKYATEYLEYAKNKHSMQLIARGYSEKSRADSAMGNFRDALVYYQIFKKMRDSMFNEKKSFQFAQLQVEYETEKKDQDIKIKQQDIELLTKESKLQEVHLKKATVTRNIIIASAAVLLALFFTGYQVKQRHNRKLELQQSEINRQNELLKHSLAEQQKLVGEKEWLVKEIHHRVKNNLQIVISLFNAQSEFLQDPSALEAIRESKERMHAIALIHQKLYQLDDHGTLINMSSYVQEMLSYLESSFVDRNKISFKASIDDISLDVSQAVPLGLILNEAITNSVKYAFPGDSKGIVGITLKRDTDKRILLKITDNGIGFPDGINIYEQNSLGIQLIRLFAEQLDAVLNIENQHGVMISLAFDQQVLLEADHGFIKSTTI